MPAHQGSRARSLITQPYRNWKDIKEDMKNHCTQQYQKHSREKLRGFLKNHKNSEKQIDHSVNTKTVRKIKNIFLI